MLTQNDGTTVTLGEIARVLDGFEDEDMGAYFDGQPAVMLKVYRTGEEDILEVAEVVKAYVERVRLRMPEAIELTIWSDESEELRERVGTLWRNAAWGLVFVLGVLALVLRFRVAFWVAAGIPIAMFGALMLFPSMGFTINTLAVMGFLLVLGIVVDDAIIVGERIHARKRAGEPRREAAVEGTLEVAVPVIFGVFTTVAAFCPLLLVPGRMGPFFAVLGGTVIVCLLLSLIEAHLILPSHLADWLPDSEDVRGDGWWSGFQRDLADGLERFVARRYEPALERVLAWRYLAVAVAVGVLILTVGLFASGRVTFQFFPGIEGDHVYASVTLPEGTPLVHAEEVMRQLETSAYQLSREIDRESDSPGPTVAHVFSLIGQQIPRRGGPRGSVGSGTNLMQVALELSPSTERDVTGREVARRWRELAGPIPDAVEASFEAMHMHAGEAIAIQLTADDVEELVAAAADLRAELATYEGVFDIADTFRAGKQEVELRILPEARPLGITQSDLARQVRTAFYGTEVQRIQRGQDDVRVMLRYPEEERRSLGDLENMRIRAPDGTEIPFAAVARAELGRGFASIRRTDGRRVVTVSADVDRSVITPEEVMASLRQGPLREILERHPGLGFSLEGEQRERAKAMTGLAQAFLLALGVIYVLLAIPLRSYAQPLIIMAAIPFGAIGAILGHFIMGWDLVFFSLLGIVALSGVVVNDSLLLVDFINRRHREGLPLERAVRIAGMTRFRPISLTSATTFMGLVPLMFNVSEATFFAVPIAISLAFGVVFATAITLFVVPCGYLILDDLRGSLGRHGEQTPQVLSQYPSIHG